MLVQAIGKTSNSVEQVVFITNGVHRIPSSHTCCRTLNPILTPLLSALSRWTRRWFPKELGCPILCTCVNAFDDSSAAFPAEEALHRRISAPVEWHVGTIPWLIGRGS